MTTNAYMKPTMSAIEYDGMRMRTSYCEQITRNCLRQATTKILHILRDTSDRFILGAAK